MRIVLFTGKGGVGKSTLAAATAVAAARAGEKVLVLSTDTAHSLADALDVEACPEAVPVEPGLWVQHVDTQRRLEESWAGIETYLRHVLDAVGVDPFTAAELTVLPGAEEVLALLEVRAVAAAGSYDLLVVDCAPSAETLRLLALPEALSWYFERIVPVQRRAVQAFRPLLTRAAGVPMPADDVFSALQRLRDELEETRRLLTAPVASVRLVMTPERVVLAETRRTYSVLTMFGHRVEGVVLNRMFPPGGDTWREGWVAAQHAVRAEAADSFAGLRIWEAPYAASEPRGPDALAALAGTVYAERDAATLPARPIGLEVTGAESETVVSMPLPLVHSDEVGLARRGRELIVTVGSYRRFISLPPGLEHHAVAGARVRDGLLQVRLARTERREGAR